MYGPNRFKLGIFSANADGGLTLTRVPERWPARWHEVVEVAQMADRAGIEFFLPIARWKGFGGEMNSREWSFETLTHAAALAGVVAVEPQGDVLGVGDTIGEKLTASDLGNVDRHLRVAGRGRNGSKC